MMLIYKIRSKLRMHAVSSLLRFIMLEFGFAPRRLNVKIKKQAMLTIKYQHALQKLGVKVPSKMLVTAVLATSA